jgi:hypothetical protein
LNRLAQGIAACVLALQPACIAPSVVASSGRAVQPHMTELEWRATQPQDLHGLFESIAIEGEVAAALWKIYYVFDAAGTYSGAALVLGDGAPHFQTLSGSWTLDGQTLDLGAGQAMQVASAQDHLKLANDQGVAILRRVEVQ